MHVQVSHPDGETRFWRVPAAALAKAVGLTARQLADAQDVVEQELLVRFQDFPWFRQATIEALTRVE